MNIIDVIINSMLLTISIAFIIGFSGFIENFKIRLYYLLNGKKINYKPYSIKPVDCELCMTFWVILFYNLFNDNNIINSMLISTLCAYIAPILTKLMNYIFYKISDRLTD